MSAVAIAAPTFDQINRNAQVYPAFLLPEGGSALSLFSAGFHGWNDVIHMARRNMRIECVDVDAEKLWEMAGVYPDPIAYHVADAWEFAERAAQRGQQWDVVSVDPYMGDASAKAWETLYLWTSLARELVTLTVATDTKLNVPEGWECSFFPRNSRVAWMVLQRA